VVGTFIKNSNNKPVICRMRLAKGRCNLFVYKPILVNNSGIKEIIIDNGKSPQPIIKPEGIC